MPTTCLRLSLLALILLSPLSAQSNHAPTRFPLATADFRVRDPFVLADASTGLYHLYVQTGNRLQNADPNLGVEVYRSRDLKHWSKPVLAFQRPADFWGGEQIWAPEVHHLGDHYYLFVTFKDVSEIRGGFRGSHILRSDSPTGPFVEFSRQATTPPEQRALDASPFVDQDGQNWMIYCHEWAQIVDGGMLAVKMADDWSRRLDDPILLFSATEAPWVRSISSARWADGKPGFVTDGPAFHHLRSGKLLMLWSSFGDNGYAVGIAESASGKITGPWIQRPKPLFAENGGHTMLFNDFDGQLLLALHQPNGDQLERARFFRVIEEDESLHLEPWP